MKLEKFLKDKTNFIKSFERNSFLDDSKVKCYQFRIGNEDYMISHNETYGIYVLTNYIPKDDTMNKILLTTNKVLSIKSFISERTKKVN